MVKRHDDWICCGSPWRGVSNTQGGANHQNGKILKRNVLGAVKRQQVYGVVRVWIRICLL